jgi:hypothetical protein
LSSPPAQHCEPYTSCRLACRNLVIWLLQNGYV